MRVLCLQCSRWFVVITLAVSVQRAVEPSDAAVDLTQTHATQIAPTHQAPHRRLRALLRVTDGGRCSEIP